MASGELATKLLALLEEQAEAQGLDIVDVEVVGTAKAPTVRVRLDRADGAPITLDEVSEKTEWVSSIVEAADPFDKPYNLEVSSPGVERPLRRPQDFERFIGEKCEIVTTKTEGRKKWTGLIAKRDEDSVTLTVDNQDVQILFAEIKKATLKPELNFKPAKKGK